MISADNAAASTPAPSPPCVGSQTYPAYPQAAEPPNVALWQSKDLPAGWRPPECLRRATYDKESTTLVVALAGHMDENGGIDALLTRMGAISNLKSVRYWSVTEKQWNILFPQASALQNADAKSARADFAAADLQPGRELYFVTADNRSGAEMIERLRIRARDDNHIAMDTENVSPMKALFVTIAGPGDIQTYYDLRRGADGAWLFYSLTRIANVPSILTYAIRGDSYINRAVAMFRYLSGVPTDRDPAIAQ